MTIPVTITITHTQSHNHTHTHNHTRTDIPSDFLMLTRAKNLGRESWQEPIQILPELPTTTSVLQNGVASAAAGAIEGGRGGLFPVWRAYLQTSSLVSGCCVHPWPLQSFRSSDRSYRDLKVRLEANCPGSVASNTPAILLCGLAQEPLSLRSHALTIVYRTSVAVASMWPPEKKTRLEPKQTAAVELPRLLREDEPSNTDFPKP